jgi:hypothetical protein
MHFAVPIELKSIEAFALKRQARFPRNEDMLEMSTSFDAKTTRTASTMKKVGRKLHSPDGARVIVITPAQLAVIQRHLIRTGIRCAAKRGNIGSASPK